MEKLTKLAKQWSTYRGLFLVAGAAFGLPVLEAAELVETGITAGVAVIGAYDALRDEASG